MDVKGDEMGRLQQALNQKLVELTTALQKRDGIAIERSADQMDEIQYASERDLAIGNVHRESALLRNVKGALWRVRDGSFGVCLECESPISLKRLEAVPWASHCIRCQEIADRDGRAAESDFINENLADVA